MSADSTTSPTTGGGAWRTPQAIPITAKSSHAKSTFMITPAEITSARAGRDFDSKSRPLWRASVASCSPPSSASMSSMPAIRT
ncbi:MAG: hypothetical protein P8177_06495 [Gemmatimonadota bacterium]